MRQKIKNTKITTELWQLRFLLNYEAELTLNYKRLNENNKGIHFVVSNVLMSVCMQSAAECFTAILPNQLT